MCGLERSFYLCLNLKNISMGHLWISRLGKREPFVYHGLGVNINSLGINIELLWWEIDIWWKGD